MSKETDKRLNIGIIIGCIIIFAVITLMVTTSNAEWLDNPIRCFIYDMRNESTTSVMTAVTFLGNWQTITGICILLLLLKKTRIQCGIPVAIGAILVTVINNILKVLIKRTRPDDIIHLVNAEGYSFPSGHSITSMCVYGLIIYLIYNNIENIKMRNTLIAVLSVPLIGIGITRIYLGVHYPSDVIAGWVLGLAVMSAIILFLGIFNNSSVKKDTL